MINDDTFEFPNGSSEGGYFSEIVIWTQEFASSCQPHRASAGRDPRAAPWPAPGSSSPRGQVVCAPEARAG